MKQIVAVRRVPSVPVKCVQVSSPSHLYQAGPGRVPTHNSALLSGVGPYLLVAKDRGQPSIVYNEAAIMVESSPALSSNLQNVRSASTDSAVAASPT